MISFTQITSFAKCPREYYLKYRKGVRLKKRPVYFVTGSAVHKAIEAWRLGGSWETALRNAFALSPVEMERMNQADLDRLRTEEMKAYGMVAGYVSRYADDQKHESMVEKEFTLQVGKDVLHGFIDCMIRFEDGWALQELKTASQPDQDYFNRVRLDWQVMLYMLGAKSLLGEFPKYLLYDVIVKPQIRLRQNEGLEDYRNRLVELYTGRDSDRMFVRERLILPTKNVKEAMKEVALFNAIRRKMNEMEYWPKNPNSCTGRYGSCLFLPICSNNGIIDSRLFFTKEEE
ncbi:MAG: PD-(D/E)XK nuclease family protein [Bacteroidetes bacterium]|nr:MAG: PD-(D/E)XK nuclease family protein [Bacteroidota bacterium]